MKQIRIFLKRKLKPVDWFDLRSLQPISRKFGFDRGMPVDRFYIEKFLNENNRYIKGSLLEIADDFYSKKFGSEVEAYNVLHVDSNNKKATIVGDLASPKYLPSNVTDCFICTQTLNFIYDIKTAVDGIKQLLKPDGTALITLAGLSQISRYDMDRWGDYWRFTSLSAEKLFSEAFGKKNISIKTYGNVLSAIALLEGLSVGELTKDELEFIDPDYQLIIAVVAQKKL
ncbi:MAG: methyltransferase domain-containing protein [Ignavibacteriaceae bacterium]